MRTLSLVLIDFRFLTKAETSSLFDFMHNKESRTKIADAELGNFIPHLIHCLKRKLTFRFKSMHCALAVLSVLESFRFSTRPMYLKIL